MASERPTEVFRNAAELSLRVNRLTPERRSSVLKTLPSFRGLICANRVPLGPGNVYRCSDADAICADHRHVRIAEVLDLAASIINLAIASRICESDSFMVLHSEIFVFEPAIEHLLQLTIEVTCGWLLEAPASIEVPLA